MRFTFQRTHLQRQWKCLFQVFFIGVSWCLEFKKFFLSASRSTPPKEAGKTTNRFLFYVKVVRVFCLMFWFHVQGVVDLVTPVGLFSPSLSFLSFFNLLLWVWVSQKHAVKPVYSILTMWKKRIWVIQCFWETQPTDDVKMYREGGGRWPRPGTLTS